MASPEFNEIKQLYQDSAVAKKYHESFTSGHGLCSWRFRIVSNMERRVVRYYLGLATPRKVIDLPCGTGKLATVFANMDAQIIAADISSEMLIIAKETFRREKVKKVAFYKLDAEALSENPEINADVLVCLRLMQRIPDAEKLPILKGIRTAASYAIISFGIESRFHAMRRFIRNLILGGGTSPLCSQNLRSIKELLSKEFEIIDSRWVVPFLSQEIIFFLRSKKLPSPQSEG